MKKKKKKTKVSKNEKFRFEKIVPLNQLFPEKLLKEKLNTIQKSPIVKNSFFLSAEIN